MTLELEKGMAGQNDSGIRSVMVIVARATTWTVYTVFLSIPDKFLVNFLSPLFQFISPLNVIK